MKVYAQVCWVTGAEFAGVVETAPSGGGVGGVMPKAAGLATGGGFATSVVVVGVSMAWVPTVFCAAGASTSGVEAAVWGSAGVGPAGGGLVMGCAI